MLQVDPDGTVYDWDDEKQAWFPRINEDFIAKYQMTYGSELGQGDTDSSTPPDATKPPTQDSPASTVDYASIPPPPDDINDPAYSEWYQRYGEAVSSEGYRRWYEYYYGASSSENADSKSEKRDETETATEHSANPDDASYWEKLKTDAENDALSGKTLSDQTQSESETGEQQQKGKKKAKVKPPPKPATWFEMDDANNTSVYISNLPLSTTFDELKDLANKYGGLVAFDPLTRKPKLKLYKDEAGNFKGDALCTYIKTESVDIALKILDGMVIDGCKLTVEKARFELKGSFDPSKRKRKLTNKEKKAFREKQAKLFEWRPDKGRFARSRNEKTVIVKNMFTLEEVDRDLMLVSELEKDMRVECGKYGDVKKVKVYERNAEGVVSVTFAEAEEADVCRDALNGRWFACRQLRAETWDGKTKYFVEETEAEYKARLKKWEAYLEGKTPDSSNEAPVPPKPVRQENSDAQLPGETDEKNQESTKS